MLSSLKNKQMPEEFYKTFIQKKTNLMRTVSDLITKNLTIKISKDQDPNYIFLNSSEQSDYDFEEAENKKSQVPTLRTKLNNTANVFAERKRIRIELRKKIKKRKRQAAKRHFRAKHFSKSSTNINFKSQKKLEDKVENADDDILLSI